MALEMVPFDGKAFLSDIKRIGISLYEASDLSGSSHNYFSNALKKKRVNRDVLARFCRAKHLCVDDYIIGNNGKPKKRKAVTVPNEKHFIPDTTGCDECVYWDDFGRCCSYILITGKMKGWQRGPTCKVKDTVHLHGRTYNGIVHIDTDAFMAILRSKGISKRAASLAAGMSGAYIQNCMHTGKINKQKMDTISKTFDIDLCAAIKKGKANG